MVRGGGLAGYWGTLMAPWGWPVLLEYLSHRPGNSKRLVAGNILKGWRVAIGWSATRSIFTTREIFEPPDYDEVPPESPASSSRHTSSIRTLVPCGTNPRRTAAGETATSAEVWMRSRPTRPGSR